MKACIAVIAVLLAAAPALAQDKKTERLWKMKCASCHGVDGAGKTETGAAMGIGDMTSAAFLKDLTDDKMRATIENGFTRKKNGKEQEMKAFKESLKPEEIDGLVGWVKALRK